MPALEFDTQRSPRPNAALVGAACVELADEELRRLGRIKDQALEDAARALEKANDANKAKTGICV